MGRRAVERYRIFGSEFERGRESKPSMRDGTRRARRGEASGRRHRALVTSKALVLYAAKSTLYAVEQMKRGAHKLMCHVRNNMRNLRRLTPAVGTQYETVTVNS